MENEMKKKAIQRLKIIEGQVRGLQKMVDNDKYCIDIITQTLSVEKALSGVEDIILKNHLSSCVIEQIKGQEEEKAIKEILNIYTLSKK